MASIQSQYRVLFPERFTPTIKCARILFIEKFSSKSTVDTNLLKHNEFNIFYCDCIKNRNKLFLSLFISGLVFVILLSLTIHSIGFYSQMLASNVCGYKTDSLCFHSSLKPMNFSIKRILVFHLIWLKKLLFVSKYYPISKILLTKQTKKSNLSYNLSKN